MTISDDRRRLEVVYTRKAALTLPEHEQELWFKCRKPLRYMSYADKIFIVWTVDKGKGRLADVLRLKDVDINFHDGLAVKLVNGEGQHVWASHTPARLFGFDAFCHIPYIPDVRFTPTLFRGGTENELQLPLVMKVFSDPEEMVEGHVYVTNIKQFVALNPGYAGRQF